MDDDAGDLDAATLANEELDEGAATNASAWPGLAAQEAERAAYRANGRARGGCLDLEHGGPDPDDVRDGYELDLGRRHFGHGWT